MIKYKLKKDTFFYEAGTVCTLTPAGHLVVDDDQITLLYKHELEYHPELLDEWFEKIEEKKYGGRVPKKGDTYWFIASTSSVFQETWDGSEWDTKIFECGSAFWTREETEKELKRRKAYVILKEDTKGFEPNWKNIDVAKYVVFYDWSNSAFDVYERWQRQEGALVFTAKEDAFDSIKNHRQQWVDYLQLEEKE